MGAKRTDPKPVKRFVDPGFSLRLGHAMNGLTDAQLARDVGCSKAVIGQYRKGEKKNPEALLLFEIADRLKVSPRWLLTGVEEKAAQPTPEPPRRAQRPRKALGRTVKTSPS